MTYLYMLQNNYWNNEVWLSCNSGLINRKCCKFATHNNKYQNILNLYCLFLLSIYFHHLHFQLLMNLMIQTHLTQYTVPQLLLHHCNYNHFHKIPVFVLFAAIVQKKANKKTNTTSPAKRTTK